MVDLKVDIPRQFTGYTLAELAQRVAGGWKGKAHPKKVVFNFSTLEFVRPTGVVFLSNICHWLNAAHRARHATRRRAKAEPGIESNRAGYGGRVRTSAAVRADFGSRAGYLGDDPVAKAVSTTRSVAGQFTATGVVAGGADRDQVRWCVERPPTGSLMRSTFETGALPHRWQTSQRLIAASYAIRNFAVTSSQSPHIGHLRRPLDRSLLRPAAEVGGLLEALSLDFFDRDILDLDALDRPERDVLGRVLNRLREMLLVVLRRRV
jgi:hypothetical protein